MQGTGAASLAGDSALVAARKAVNGGGGVGEADAGGVHAADVVESGADVG